MTQQELGELGQAFIKYAKDMPTKAKAANKMHKVQERLNDLGLSDLLLQQQAVCGELDEQSVRLAEMEKVQQEGLRQIQVMMAKQADINKKCTTPPLRRVRTCSNSKQCHRLAQTPTLRRMLPLKLRATPCRKSSQPSARRTTKFTRAVKNCRRTGEQTKTSARGRSHRTERASGDRTKKVQKSTSSEKES